MKKFYAKNQKNDDVYMLIYPDITGGTFLILRPKFQIAAERLLSKPID